MNANIFIGNDRLRAEIVPLGAELVRLQDQTGADWLHDGDPAWWTGRAPNLFPMVGRATGDRIRVDGQLFPLPQHGFARRSVFSVVTAEPARAVLRLEADSATRMNYPFAFRLDLAYALDGDTLNVVATVANDDDRPMPFSFGFHPAFRWPLPGAKGAHELRFEKPEVSPIRRLSDGFLDASNKNPAVSGVLELEPALFDAGALIFDDLSSRRVAFGPPGGPELAVSFPGMPHFGVWTKPGGAPFLCLEPWQGFAAPLGFDGEFAQRPGVVTLAPGEERRFVMDITITK